MTVLFDLDGTLTDSRAGIVSCIQHALLQMGRPAPPAHELTRYAGPPLADSFATLLATADAELIEQAIAAYRERFERVGFLENAVYPGVADAVARLGAEGHDLYVVTAKPHVYARRILEHFELAGLFRAVYGPELGERRYTKQSLIRRAREVEGFACERTVMVGDRADDVIGARRCGVRAVAVTWGYGDPAELEAAGPDHVVRSCSELVALIGRLH